MPSNLVTEGIMQSERDTNLKLEVITYTAFFLPRPLGFGCASSKAAYSGSRAFCNAVYQAVESGHVVGRAMRTHLDINEMLEEVGLTQKVGVALDSIGYLVIRNQHNSNRKETVTVEVFRGGPS